MLAVLEDVLPPKWRKVAYLLLTLLAVVFAAWKAADGDWVEFIGGLVTMLTGGMAASNTHASEPPPELP